MHDVLIGEQDLAAEVQRVVHLLQLRLCGGGRAGELNDASGHFTTGLMICVTRHKKDGVNCSPRR